MLAGGDKLDLQLCWDKSVDGPPTVEITGISSLEFALEPVNAGWGKFVGGALNVSFASRLDCVADLEAG